MRSVDSELLVVDLVLFFTELLGKEILVPLSVSPLRLSFTLTPDRLEILGNLFTGSVRLVSAVAATALILKLRVATDIAMTIGFIFIISGHKLIVTM